MVLPALMTDGLDDRPDADLVAGARVRDEGAIRALTARYNQRLFRIARAIVRSDPDAEDVVQEAYVRAFTGLREFRGDSTFGTWITRIVLNEALGRVRRRRVTVDFTVQSEPGLRRQIIQFPAASRPEDPERTVANDELRVLLERAIDALPDTFRAVFVARVVEGLSVEDTAAAFGIQAATVKTRVHRARARLRRELERQLVPATTSAFPFMGARCERMTVVVLTRLGLSA